MNVIESQLSTNAAEQEDDAMPMPMALVREHTELFQPVAPPASPPVAFSASEALLASTQAALTALTSLAEQSDGMYRELIARREELRRREAAVVEREQEVSRRLSEANAEAAALRERSRHEAQETLEQAHRAAAALQASVMQSLDRLGVDLQSAMSALQIGPARLSPAA